MAHLHTQVSGSSHDPEGSPKGTAWLDSRQKGRRALAIAAVLTGIFMILEFGAGWFSNSLALVSDSAHMLTDFGALLLSLFALWLSSQESGPRLTYGYHRAEILGALANGLLIWLLTGVLVYEAISRLSHPPEVNAPVVVGIAILGGIINLAVMGVLHREKDHSLNLKGAYLHVLSDLLGSFAALLSGIAIWVGGWKIIDPIATFVVAALVLRSSWNLIRESIEVLMESVPRGLDPGLVREGLEQIPTVIGVHDLHIWTVASGRVALSAHIESDQSEETLERANQILRVQFGIHHSTLQIEKPGGAPNGDCLDCTGM